ncbi:hypothetical protein SDJN02_07309, partial [Cucurbita argyrosperma subsp. argyrosperma]
MDVQASLYKDVRAHWLFIDTCLQPNGGTYGYPKRQDEHPKAKQAIVGSRESGDTTMGRPSQGLMGSGFLILMVSSVATNDDMLEEMKQQEYALQQNGKP